MLLEICGVLGVGMFQWNSNENSATRYPTRPNGHKNLGIALAGQGNFREAAQCFVTATRVDASDRRSFDLLTKLLAEHPELEFEFAVEVECCRQAVGVAAGEVAKLKPVVHRGFRKRLFLLRMRLQAFAQGLRKLAGMKGTGDTK